MNQQDRSRSLSFRSYGAEELPHSHGHVQIVLPVWGKLEIEVGGRGGLLNLSRGIFIAPGIKHSQSSAGRNRFLILDCDISQIHDAEIERLSKHSLLDISDATRSLIQFIDLSTHARQISTSVSQFSLPLLLDSLLNIPAQPLSRLAMLLRRIERSLGEDWPVARMAKISELSVSRLHALFQLEMGTTPQNWLSATRLRRAQDVLANSTLPIAEIALQFGYSDQTALTRAMRRITKITPGAYRRQRQR